MEIVIKLFVTITGFFGPKRHSDSVEQVGYVTLLKYAAID